MASYFDKKFRGTRWRTNQSIRAGTLRVITADGKQVGVLPTATALQKAQEEGLDLVEIVPKANPPVAKIIDFAKFRYQQDKKEREAKLKEKRGTEQKEIWFTPFIADNDYQVRLNRVREFLEDGHKVRTIVKFSSRQLTHKEFGYELLSRLTSDLKAISRVDVQPKFIGRQLLMTLTPFKGRQEGKNQNAKTEN